MMVIFAQTRKKYNRAYQDYSSIDFRSVNSPNPYWGNPRNAAFSGANLENRYG